MDHWVGEGISDSAIIKLKTNCSDEALGASIKKLLHVVLAVEFKWILNKITLFILCVK
ncbi:hypothetical protein IC611_09610 [Proteus mirabilis]